MPINDVSVNAIEVVFFGKRRQIIFKGIFDQPPLEPDLVLTTTLMHIVAEDVDHQVQDFLVFAEHDVRTGSVERESLIDDRSAQAANAGALLQHFDVFV